MITRNKKAETLTPWWWHSAGFAACGIACFIFFLVFTDRPPKYESLHSSEAEVTRAPYTKWHLKGLDHVFAPLDALTGIFSNKPRVNYSYPAFDLDGSRVWIATSFESHRGSRELSQLAVGDKIRVWTWTRDGEKYAWHVAHRNITLLDYDVIAKRDAGSRQNHLHVAIGLFLVGLVLFFLRI